MHTLAAFISTAFARTSYSTFHTASSSSSSFGGEVRPEYDEIKVQASCRQ